MPTSQKPWPPDVEQPTRQQLDELDALMQRMLALPVNPLDYSPGSTADANTPASPVSPRDDAPAAEPVPLLQQPPLAESPSPMPVVRSVLLSDAGPRLQPSIALPPFRGVSGKARVSWPLLPLFWCNRVFDACTSWLGPLGRWLRAPSGRSTLAWLGALLLIAALTWLAVQGMDWTW
jgi:hypothetical protein